MVGRCVCGWLDGVLYVPLLHCCSTAVRGGCASVVGAFILVLHWCCSVPRAKHTAVYGIKVYISSAAAVHAVGRWGGGCVWVGG